MRNIAPQLFLIFVTFLATLTYSECAEQTDSSTVNLTLYSPDCNATLVPPPACSSKLTPLYIQGFFPATNLQYSTETTIPAAYAAIHDINGNCSILSDYLLHLDVHNTKCDASRATYQLMETVVLNRDDDRLKILILDGGCSPATEPVAALSGKFYNIPSLSLSASSPALSDRSIFPKFFRTIPSEIQSNSARFALMAKYGWRRIATLHQTETIFTLTVEDFHDQYNKLYNGGSTSSSEEDSEEEENQMENLLPRSFTDDPETPLKQIKEMDIRIIMGYFYEDKARETMCMAYQMNLTTENHVWMFPAWYTSDWYNITSQNDTKVNCTEEQMVEAVRYAFYLDSYNYGRNETVPTDLGDITAETFMKKYECFLNEFHNNPLSKPLLDTDSNDSHAYITFTYDGIWTMAYALQEAETELLAMGLNLTNYTYFDDTPVARVVTEKLKKVSFSGVSGDVSFDENGSRVGTNGIYQLRRKENGQFNLKLIAIHDPGPGVNGTFNLSLDFINEPEWNPLGGGQPPKDRTTPMNIYLNEGLVIACDLFIAIAIVIAVGLLIFNLATLWKPLIRDSAPHINTIIIIGCIVMLVTCILLGIDSSNPDIDEYVGTNQSDDNIFEDGLRQEILANRNYRYGVICTLRLWFLTLGFTLSFGALFAKTWQVYRVYTNPKLKKEPFTMWNFLIIMSIFLIVDVVYLSFWTGFAPFHRRTIPQTDTDNDLQRIFERCDCSQFAYLIGALYVYKGLLVVFGLFLAYESRNVKYIYINDSRFVSITMYIVVILVGIGAPLSLVLADRFFIDAAYALAVFMIIAACLSCLLIIFIPKFVYMARGKETMVRENSQDEITVSDGLQLGKTTTKCDEVTDEGELRQEVTEDDNKHVQLTRFTDLNTDHTKQGGTQANGERRTGSDGDSGVLVTGDENDTFSSVSTTNGDHQRTANTSSSIRTTAVSNTDEN